MKLLLLSGDQYDYDEDDNNEATEEDVGWIQCDKCDLWFHIPCANKEWPDKVGSEEEDDWFCGSCGD